MENKKTLELIELLTQAIKTQNQREINLYAMEITKRLYREDLNMSFEELLQGFGYKQVNDKQISIEEYMRSRSRGEIK